MNHHDGSSVTDRAYEHIRSRVLRGHYPTGKQLVTRQIAQEIGASLNPVREAIGRLAAEGLIDHRAGAGAFVHAPSPEELLEVYEFRQAIEPFAARKAAQSITEVELAILQGVCDEQHQTAESLRGTVEPLHGEPLDQWFATEERFHSTLIRAARNRLIDRTMRHSRVLTQLFHGHRALGIQVDFGVASRTWFVHQRLVRAFKKRDGDAAAEYMRGALDQGTRHALGTVAVGAGR